MMDESILFPMTTIPKDGRVIIIVLGDFSGVVAIRYGNAMQGPDRDQLKDGWWHCDWDEYYGDDESVMDAAGWICAPNLWETVPMKAAMN